MVDDEQEDTQRGEQQKTKSERGRVWRSVLFVS
jgi:hypothetical protein